MELACGKGPNLFYLTQKFPQILFSGLDLTETHVKITRRKGRSLPNIKIWAGNYHNLSGFSDQEFDIVFIIEALCYSQEKDKVLKQVKRILKPKGVFIVIDGYWKTKAKEVTREELYVKKLCELGMALNEYVRYTDFTNQVSQVGFKVIYEKDMGKYLIPNAERFEKMAGKFFNHPLLANIIKHFLPKKFTYNALFGYFVPEVLKLNWAAYMITVLEK